MTNDLRYALRQVVKHPGFALAAVLTLALGLGTTITLFSVLNAVVLRPLPAPHVDRLVSVQERSESGTFRSALSLPEFLAYRERARGTVELAAHHVSDISLNTGNGAEFAVAADVSGNYFSALGIHPALGRFFDGAEMDRPGAEAVAVIGFGLWQARLGGDSAVIGRTITVNGQPVSVVAVAPRQFRGTMAGLDTPVWLPLGLQDRLRPGSSNLLEWGARQWLQPFGRLADGASLEQARGVLTSTSQGLSETHEYFQGERPVGVRVRPFSMLPAGLRDSVTAFVVLMLGTAGVVLLIAVVNVVGMFLARVVVRRREIAIRLAMGAGRRRVVQQVAMEGLALAAFAGTIGLWLASSVGVLFTRLKPPFVGPIQLDFPVDARVVAFAVAAVVVTGLACGLVPALLVTRRRTDLTLRETTSRTARAASFRKPLVIGQLAVTLVLVICAGLFVRTLQRTLAVPAGLDADGVVAVELNLRFAGYDEASGLRFYDELVNRTRGIAGVESAALSTVIPLGFGYDQAGLTIPGFEPPPGRSTFPVGFNAVTPQYFETLRMPLLAGRTFDEHDRDGPPVAIVNETFAKRFWPDGSAVGRLVQSDGQDVQIVGVVPAGKYTSFTEEPRLYAYTPFGRPYSSGAWLQVRGRGEPDVLLATVRAELRALDSDVPPIMATTMRTVLESSLFPQKLAAVLVGAFGTLGLILASIGVFGVLSFWVVQRTKEIGVRVAVGASGTDVLRLVVGEALWMGGVGVIVGVAASFALTRLLTGMLHGLSPTDPTVFAVGAGVLLVVVSIAAAIPARQAARVDPIDALRHE
jgi:putative ABC transport system permease protein